MHKQDNNNTKSAVYNLSLWLDSGLVGKGMA